MRVTKDGRRLDVSLTISPLKDSQGRITGASKIVRDIGELVRARQILALNKEDLERLVEQRTAKLREALGDLEHMSYSMVHDMRAPLRAMQSYALILQQECASCLRSQSQEHLRRIQEAANRLDGLLTDALNYSQIARQQLPLTPVEIGRLLRGMLETYPDLQPAAADIHIEFNELVVLGNESLLTQCFGNLLGNAVKFVAPGVRPQVRIWAEVRGWGDTGNRSSSPRPRVSASCVQVWVEDNGIGIPKAAQAKVFHMFQRIHPANEYPGTGIGLALCKKIVERHGGQIEVVSVPGRGSIFRFTIPDGRPNA